MFGKEFEEAKVALVVLGRYGFEMEWINKWRGGKFCFIFNESGIVCNHVRAEGMLVR